MLLVVRKNITGRQQQKEIAPIKGLFFYLLDVSFLVDE
jgi:hypothetical protein